MGTNASRNRKVASKVVAILLAALMLLAAMPMTAFAATIKVEYTTDCEVLGLTINDASYNYGPYYDICADGQPVDLSGLTLDVTWIRHSDDKIFTETVTYDQFSQYGITVNYKADHKAALKDNEVPFSFTYEIDKTWTSELYMLVYPVDSFVAVLNPANIESGEYIVVADSKVALSNDKYTATEPVIGEQKVDDLVATEKVTVNGKKLSTIEDLAFWTAEVTDDTTVWTTEIADEDGKFFEVTLHVAAVTKSQDKVNDFYADEAPVTYGDVADVDEALYTWYVESSIDTDNDTDANKTVMYVLVDTLVVENDKNGVPKFVVKAMPRYLAVDAQGFFYVTSDESKAVNIDLYETTYNEVVDISVAKDPDKMSYVEGEYLDVDGMIVNLVYADDTVVCVPASMFLAYGIEVAVHQDDRFDQDEFFYDIELFTKRDNNYPVEVRYHQYTALTKGTLKVAQSDYSDAVLYEGDKLVSGKYVIVWNDSKNAFADMDANTVYEGIALTNLAYTSAWDVDSTYEISNLDYKYVDVINKKINVVTEDMVWTVTKGADGTWTIKDNDGNYLNTYDLTAEEKSVFVDHAKELGDKYHLLETGATAANWIINGGMKASIQLEGKVNTYIINADNDEFLGYDVDDKKEDSFYFFAVDSVEITKIAVTHNPALNYASGDKLDLNDLVAELTYSNGNTISVPFEDFAEYGITTSVANGTVLVASNNGNTITVTVNGVSANTGALNVTDSKASVKTIRMGGEDRYETAAVIANNFGYESKTVVLANSVNFPDALVGASLAYAYDAPILLTGSDALNADTAAAIKDNGVTNVIILGGTNAVSADVENELKALGVTSIARYAGADRSATSVEIAKALAAKVGASTDVIITSGANFADALSASSAAAISGTPILYVDVKGELSDVVVDYIKAAGFKSATILGGEVAVSADVVADLKDLGLTTTRVSGNDRFETSVAIAEHYAANFDGKSVVIATGSNFPDALAGGVFAASVNAPVVLVDNGCKNADAALYTNGLADMATLYVLGGESAITADTAASVLNK